MFKNIFETLILLVTQPTKAWEMISKREETHEKFLSQFIYPLIAICTIAAFIGEFARKGEGSLPNAFKEATVVFTSTFAGYYMASFIVMQISTRFYSLDSNIKFYQKYVGYAISILIVINAILEIMPDFFFLRIGTLFIFYIIWESVGSYIQIDDKKRVVFAAIVSAVIIFSPFIIQKLLFIVMPGIKAIREVSK